MIRKLGLVAALLTVAACSTSTPQPSAPTQAGPPESYTPPPTPAPSRPKDSCGASDLAYLVGKTRTAIPVPIDPTKRRVTCTTCPVTMDYRADRLNILFDSETGIIKEVKCG